MASIPCFLCGQKLEKRIDKRGKPYFVCDPCGIQLFIRRRAGIERLENLIIAVKKGEVSLAKHANSVVQIQGLLTEITGIKAELSKVQEELGIFGHLFGDRERLVAQQALETRLDNLLEKLRQMAEVTDAIN